MLINFALLLLNNNGGSVVLNGILRVCMGRNNTTVQKECYFFNISFASAVVKVRPKINREKNESKTKWADKRFEEESELTLCESVPLKSNINVDD